MINPISFGAYAENRRSSDYNFGEEISKILDETLGSANSASRPRPESARPSYSRPNGAGETVDYYDEDLPKRRISKKAVVVPAAVITALLAILTAYYATANIKGVPPSAIIEDFKGAVPSGIDLNDILKGSDITIAPENDGGEIEEEEELNLAKEEETTTTKTEGTQTPKEARMTASNDCKELIKNAEGLYLNAYKCPSGKDTIGWGHTSGVKPGDKITEEKAKKLLQEDIDECLKYVYAYVKVPLTQGQLDALVSFIFNCGSGNFQKSDLLAYLNKGDYDAAADEFDKWIYGSDPDMGEKIKLGGLIRRRAAEKEVFLS